MEEIMKPVILLCFVATNAMALDIDKEWSRYNVDFESLKQKSTVATTRSIPVPNVEKEKNKEKIVDKSTPLPSKNTQDNTMQQVDPKSPERLGHKLSDPNVRDRVVELYNKPDTVVYSATVR